MALGAMKAIALKWRNIVGVRSMPENGNGAEKDIPSCLGSSDDMTLLSEDTPYTCVVYHGNCYNKWGREHSLLKYCGGENCKTVGL